jgi:hypothetical protein
MWRIVGLHHLLEKGTKMSAAAVEIGATFGCTISASA